MSKEELYLLCSLKLKEKELYYLEKTVFSLEALENTTKNMFTGEDISRARDLCKHMKIRGIRVCAYFDEDYPPVLRNITYYPPFLFYVGQYKQEDINGIAVIGSRKASLKGIELTEKLIKELSQINTTIISGMAAGIDTKAHKTAIETGLRTIAVLGSGIDVVYPVENRALYQRIAENGVVFSEHPPKTPPLPFHFPKRNRIISGLSKAVVVVEAGERSGSLITARYAMEQNRELFVFPRTPLERNSEGNNNLIKLGAKVVTKGDDIIKDLFPDMKSSQPLKEIKLLPEEEKIISAMPEEPVNIDSLCFLLDMGPSTLANFLLILEIKGFVESLPGNVYMKNF